MFHSWSLSDWFRDEHMTQVGPIRTKTVTLAKVIIQISILFLLVLSLGDILLVAILLSQRRTCQRIEPSLKKVELEIEKYQVPMTSFGPLNLAISEVNPVVFS